jgi:hypothetical protein
VNQRNAYEAGAHLTSDSNKADWRDSITGVRELFGQRFGWWPIA